jgi:hypothetical protein
MNVFFIAPKVQNTIAQPARAGYDKMSKKSKHQRCGIIDN